MDRYQARRVIDAERRDSTPIHSVTARTFQALVLDGSGPVAVEFMSYGCAHCRAIEDPLERAAEILKNEERIFRVNVAVEQDLASAYQIRGTPTLVMFLKGNEVGRIEGPRPFVSSIVAALKKPFADRE